MTVKAVHKNPEQLTMQVESEFDAPVDRVWQLWADPRKLERWWGPPTYPATMVDHDLTVGGAVRYFMTGPEGDKHHGWWKITAVDAPHRLEFDDGFADDSGNPAEGMPTIAIEVTLADRPGGGTVMTIVSKFPSREAMDQLISMGMEEGMAAAMGQMDALLV
jgi:uncharacterized protein YndB with AHSA1/START domain